MGQNTGARPQLTMNVEPHPASTSRSNPDGWIDGEIVVKGGLAVDIDLNPGEEFTVSIAGADGEVIASGTCEMINGPSFPAIKADGKVVGHVRKHTIEVL